MSLRVVGDGDFGGRENTHPRSGGSKVVPVLGVLSLTGSRGAALHLRVMPDPAIGLVLLQTSRASGNKAARSHVWLDETKPPGCLGRNARDLRLTSTGRPLIN